MWYSKPLCGAAVFKVCMSKNKIVSMFTELLHFAPTLKKNCKKYSVKNKMFGSD